MSHSEFFANSPLLEVILDRLNMGIVVVDSQCRVMLWNKFMESHSNIISDDIIGTSLFEHFPELPKEWLQHKIHNVFVLKNYSFTSWEHRPYLFEFGHNRPITGGVDAMRQNCTLFPLPNKNGEIDYVCISISDVTDASIYEGMLQEAVRSLAEASNKDGLTDVFNRRYLEQALNTEVNRAARYGTDLSLMLFDLDHFKQINDDYGHQAGDEALVSIAQYLQNTLRQSDVLGRYGGEEFVVILPETPLEGAHTLAERIREDIMNQTISFNDIEFQVTISIGVTQFCAETMKTEDFVAAADHALYQSKERGRNCVTSFAPDTQLPEPKANYEEEKNAVVEEQTQQYVKCITIGHK